MALHGERPQRVLDVFPRKRLAARQGHEQLFGLRALHGDGGIAVGDVGKRDVITLGLALQVGEVLVDVARVDDEEILFRLKAVEICVVNGAAVLIGDDAVLRLIEIQRLPRCWTGRAAKTRTMSGPFDVDTAHMGHVENGAVAAAVEMFRRRCPSGYWMGISQPAEVDHRCPGVQMGLIEYGSFQLRSWCSSLFPDLRAGCAPAGMQCFDNPYPPGPPPADPAVQFLEFAVNAQPCAFVFRG